MAGMDETDMTRFPEDDDPQTLAGEDAEDQNDLTLKWQGVVTLPQEMDHG